MFGKLKRKYTLNYEIDRYSACYILNNLNLFKKVFYEMMLLTRNYLYGLQLVSVKRKMQMLQKVFAMINATQQLHNKYE